MIALLLLLVLSLLTVAVLATVRHDGYGSRPGPRSHHDSFPPRPLY